MTNGKRQLKHPCLWLVLGQAEDIAEAVAFFASNRSKYITGQRLYVERRL